MRHKISEYLQFLVRADYSNPNFPARSNGVCSHTATGEKKGTISLIATKLEQEKLKGNVFIE